MAPRNLDDIFLPCSRQFWHKICRQATRQPSHKSPQIPLHCYHQLGMWSLLWHHTILVILPPQSHPINDRICKKALHKYKHPPLPHPENALGPVERIHYGNKPNHLTKANDESKNTTKSKTTQPQGVIGTFLFYVRSINSSMSVPLRKMASAISAPTKTNAQYLTQLLNYVHPHPDSTTTFHASDMIIHTHSDEYYPYDNNRRSLAGGINFSTAEIPTTTTVQMSQFW